MDHVALFVAPPCNYFITKQELVLKFIGRIGVGETVVVVGTSVYNKHDGCEVPHQRNFLGLLLFFMVFLVSKDGLVFN